MKLTHFVVFITILSFCNCSTKKNEIIKIEAHKSKKINKTLQGNKEIEDWIRPYSEHINKSLDSTICYSPITLTKKDSELESTLGNFIADLCIQEANPILKKKFNKVIDFCLLNHGGLRNVISEGDISTRNAYEVMPFENKLIACELSGKKTNELFDYLLKNKKAHPIGNLRLSITNKKIISAEINGSPFDENNTYIVLTSDYLVNGGDGMNFFKNALNYYKINYKVRAAIIDHLMKIDTIQPILDQRFIIKN